MKEVIIKIKIYQTNEFSEKIGPDVIYSKTIDSKDLLAFLDIINKFIKAEGMLVQSGSVSAR